MPLVTVIEAQMAPTRIGHNWGPIQDWVRWVVGMFVGPTVDIYTQNKIRWTLAGILPLTIKGMVQVETPIFVFQPSKISALSIQWSNPFGWVSNPQSATIRGFLLYRPLIWIIKWAPQSVCIG